jgi:predicted ATPase
MNFKFENLGTIEFADIAVEGLTVITGLNDTGKSFLGKSIFSIVKTINGAEKFNALSKRTQINQIANQIFTQHRQYVGFTSEKINKFHPSVLGNIAYPARFFEDEKKKIETETEIIKNVQTHIASIIDDLTNSTKGVSVPISTQIQETIKSIQLFKDRIIDIIKEPTSQEKKYKKYFDEQIIQRFFQLQLNSIDNADSTLNIEVKAGVNQVIHVKIKGNNTEEFNKSQPFLINDATIIETPTIIQLEAFISNSFFPDIEYQDRSDLPFHYSDLVRKIKVPVGSIDPKFNGVYEKIRKIINGEFRINLNTGGSIEYWKDDKTPIKPSNVASGIKSFGLLQMLIKSNYIGLEKYLIIDEPEVHLHPQWENHYADIIVELALLGIKIIISSHSPYFLRKIRAAVIANKEAEKITEFYWGQKNENGKSKFERVTDNPEIVFKALAEAMSATAYPKKK